jgi:hypothetical protein
MEAKLDEVQAKLNELSGSDAHKRKSRKKTAAV